MSNDAYQNAVAKRDALKKELNKVEEFLALYQQFESDNLISKEDEKPLDLKAKTHDLTAASQRRKPSKKPTPTVLKDLTKAVLKENGKPLSRREIITAIEAKGYSIPSKNKGSYLGSLLHRFKTEISTSEGRGYWFTGLEPGQMPESESKN